MQYFFNLKFEKNMKFSPGKIQKLFGFENQQNFAKIIIIICKNLKITILGTSKYENQLIRD